MNLSPIDYYEPVFRPPSEWRSLILQVTHGCSWNKCNFCEMYKSKNFTIKDISLIENELKLIKEHQIPVKRIFLADGNAMVLSTSKLLNIINLIKKYFPELNRISSYALANDILSKSDSELSELKAAGLDLIYVGIESGDDSLLKMINKGEDFNSTVKGLLKSKNAGIKSSIMILTGLGGMVYSKQHAINSAKIVNLIQPEYVSTLVLSFPYGLDHYKKQFNGDFKEMNQIQLIEELKLFLEKTELNRSIFRSDHASNYLILKGILGRDKNSLLDKIDYALTNPSLAHLREEWQRGL